MHRHKFSLIIFLACFIRINASEISIVPSGDDDALLIQNALDSIQPGDTLLLVGDFIIAGTIYLPSDFTWILNGSLTLAGDADLDEAGWVEPGVDATRRTGITEKSGGATNIEMSGGTYYGNSAQYSKSMRFINFVSVTNSRFHDMHITEVTDDNFTLGPGSNNNECRNLIGSFAGGNALTDKGDHNKWYDCIAEDCDSDGWTPKCRFSEFHRCIGRRNAGPGFGMFARLDGSGDPVDLGEIIVGNKFYDCESYDNYRGGFSFNIAGTSGHGSVIRDNYIQAVCYNNRRQGVTFRNKQEDGIIENNEVDIVVYGNQGLTNDGNISAYAGGLGLEGSMSGIFGSVVAYDNGGYDVNLKNASNCTIRAYHPVDQNQPVLDFGSNGNIIEVKGFQCLDQLEAWCQYKYCGADTPPMPNAPANLNATVVSSSQINLSWSDTTHNEDGFVIEQKTDGIFGIVATVDANISTYSLTELTELTAYSYRVSAFNVSGFSDYSNETSATTEAAVTTSKQDPAAARDIELFCYPNPFQEITRINYTVRKDCKVSIKVFDSTGRETNALVNENRQAGQYSATFHAGDLPGGTYYCRLYTDDLVKTKQIILLK
jgi:hypothetical protein